MKYNYKKIGRRIKETRKAKGFSQERLMNALRDNQIPVGRNTLSAMENGVFESFSFQVLSGIATLCDCEIGYLYVNTIAKLLIILKYTKKQVFQIMQLTVCNYFIFLLIPFGIVFRQAVTILLL